MKVGWIGLGKLGLPCALVLADRGHQVFGYDINPNACNLETLEFVEPGVPELLHRNRGVNFIQKDTLAEVVRECEIVFVAVQTPHAPQYGGQVPVPEQTRDFEYAFLVQAVRDIVANARHDLTMVIISTVLPGTTQRRIQPLLTPNIKLIYSPLFIAMGTVVNDFVNPEFMLIGTNGDQESVDNIRKVYDPVHDAPRYVTTVPNAEMIKVIYNTFISMKLVWVNHVAQLCEATGTDVDAITGALALGHDRIISTTYLSAGMGDGGACHPRDLIALADLENRAGTPNFFHHLATMRDVQTKTLAQTVADWKQQCPYLPVAVLGKSYKAEVALTQGSPALLLAHYLRELGVEFTHRDPFFNSWIPVSEPAIYVIATAHESLLNQTYPKGSIVIDPWGGVKSTDGVTLVRIGRA